MFQRNLKDGKQYSYFSIEFVDDNKGGYWIAWYYRDLRDNFNGQIEEIISESGNGE